MDVPYRTCKDCHNFIGFGDWNLCCTVNPWLCYEFTPACEKYKPHKYCRDCINFNGQCEIFYMQLCSEDTRACIKFVEKGSNHA